MLEEDREVFLCESPFTRPDNRFKGFPHFCGPTGVEELHRYTDSKSFRRPPLQLAAMSGKPGILTGLDLRMSCKPEHYERNERKEKQQEGNQENFMFE
jgi:hypothetical protein